MQENCTFSIIPYGITMSKIFSFLFIVPNDSTMSSFLPHPCRAQHLFCIIIFQFCILPWQSDKVYLVLFTTDLHTKKKKDLILRYSFTSSATDDYPSPFQFQLVTICNLLISVVRYLRTSHLLPQSVTIRNGFIFSFYKQISMSMITCCVFQFPSRTIFLLRSFCAHFYLLYLFDYFYLVLFTLTLFYASRKLRVSDFA